MNYRHGFHAGNFADILKHTALCETLRLLTVKDKRLFVLDTHAGAGGYDLSAERARRTGEAEAGIGRLLGARNGPIPAAVARYLAAVEAYDRKFGRPAETLRRYPGSPRLIRGALRPGDRLVACEKHHEEALLLKREFAGDRAVEIRQADGYHAIKATLPPPERRGLIVVDPPFEAKDEFDALARAVRQGLRRFAVGCYLIWYPLKDTAEASAFGATLAGLKRLTLELHLGPDIAMGKLGGCGVTVINPPWKLEEAMREALPWIAARLGEGVRSRIDAGPASGPGPESVA